MEKVDLKAVVKNYEIIYQLADFCECRIPTKKALEIGLAKADKDQKFKISGYTQAQARAAYVAYEASKLHMMCLPGVSTATTHRGQWFYWQF